MSNLTREMASPQAVLEWCRGTCATYPNVEIKNLSTSFRDGLAFCAIIHKHRPKLIDFGSLSKDNVYQNNKLAFDTAERKLGIPALLDPKDMVSTKTPDRLGVITYVSQYYYFFNRKLYAGLPSLKSLNVTFLNNLTKGKTDGLRPLKSLADLESGPREDRPSDTRPRTVCSLCFKPIHLIQRHLIDGKVYHRSCFRCKVCRSTLLPGSYTQGSDDGSLICTHHVTDSKSSDLNLPIRSAEDRPRCEFQAGYLSLGGLAVTSVPHYTKQTEPQDRLVCETPETEGKEGGGRDSTVVVRKPARAPLPSVGVKDGGAEPVMTESKTQQEVTETQTHSEVSSPCVQETEGSSRPVPAPRRMLDSSAAPVPAPRTRTAQPGSSSPAAGNSSNQNRRSSNSSQVSSPTRSKVQINHPWKTIVSPGPWAQLPPVSAPVPTPRHSKHVNPRAAPSNPFGEEEEEEDADAGRPSGGAQCQVLPRSISVPAFTNESDQVTSRQSKSACKENPFDRKPRVPKSKTFQALPSARAPAPGHGFPLIKRKVQTDQNMSTEDLQAEIRELDKHLEALELKGVEVEANLRQNKNDEEEERMLMEWLSLIHERHVLVRRDTELVHLTKQQKLEERQSDVEYQIRCLLNKPESDRSQKERAREQQLMDELVAIIDQRNQIISSLDQDLQRERDEDMLFEAVMENKELQKEGLKELKKSKGKFKATKMFKMLNHKAERTRDSMDKKS